MRSSGGGGGNFRLPSGWNRPVACGCRLVNSTDKPNEALLWPFERVLRALEEARVRFLIIGGQAAVIYGVSQFTQDADIWVEPTAGNVAALRRALKALHARPRFLPPLELRYLKRGHGIHFSVPHGDETYHLDVLGKPPRVGSFAAAWRAATLVTWRGLRLRVADIPRLVLTKKTNRDQDYVAIRRLAELVFHQVAANARLRASAAAWLLKELRTPKLLKTVALRWKSGKAIATRTRRPAALLAARNASDLAIQAALDEEKARCQQANLAYWRPFLKELRELRRSNRQQRKG